MAVTVALSRSTASVIPGDYVALVVTALNDGVPVSGQAVTAASSDTGKVRVVPGVAQDPAGWADGATTTTGAVSPGGVTSTKYTETATTGFHMYSYTNLLTAGAVGTVVLFVAEVRPVGRTAMTLNCYNETDGGHNAIVFDFTGSGSIYSAWNSLGGTTPVGGICSLGDGWFRVWNVTTIDAARVGDSFSYYLSLRSQVGQGPEQYLGVAGGSYYFELGTRFYVHAANATTNSSGNVPLWLLGVATGTSNVNATVSGVTSSNTVVTTIPASSLVLAVDEPAPARDDYIKATAAGAVVEFDLDPISQPASGTSIVIEYDASNTGGSAVRVEVIDPRVY
jgi:hypothetical protein